MADEREIRFEAALRAAQFALLRGAGASANNVVAGMIVVAQDQQKMIKPA